MKFDAKLSGLYKAMMPALSIASKPLIKDFYESNKVLLEAKNDKLHVYANNGRMFISSKLCNIGTEGIDFDFQEDGTVTVDSEDLNTALNSFDPDELLSFSVDDQNNELKVVKKDDAEQFQTIPVLSKNIEAPDLPEKFIKTLKINRELFVSSAEKIAFAVGFEEQVPQFLYWLLRIAANKKARFIAGNKNRFAICEVEDDTLVNSTPATTNLLFAKEHTPLLMKALASIEDKDITVKQADPKGDNYGLLIETQIHVISMSNMAPNAQWPDENKILNYPFTHKVVSKVENWMSANRGSLAALKDGAKDGKPHKATLEFNYKAKNVKIVVNDVKKSARKVDLTDAEFPEKDTVEAFDCVSPYLQEINKLGHKNGYVQIEFASRNKPIVLRFTNSQEVQGAADAVNVRSHGYGEKVMMFFAPLVS